MTGGTLLRFWRRLFPPADGAPAAPPESAGHHGSGAGAIADAPPARAPARRRYAAPLPDSDMRREAHLGAVLEALTGGPLDRGELGHRVGAADWGSGRLDAVVDHGLAVHVLVEDDDGTVRARYAD